MPTPTSQHQPQRDDRRRRMHAVCRNRGLSPNTEEAHFAGVRRIGWFHGLRHPADLGEADFQVFLEDLAVRGRVSASALRVMDVDFEYGVIHLKRGEGTKDHRTAQPARSFASTCRPPRSRRRCVGGPSRPGFRSP